MSAPQSNPPTPHSPEPWGLTYGDPYDAKGTQIANMYACYVDGAYVGDANARRIVACVNACAGIPTEALEADGVGAAIRQLQGLLKTVQSSMFKRADVVEDITNLLQMLNRLP